MAKIFKSDGTFYYSYYKKKLGRKKKRGPKKKYKKKAIKNYKQWNYKILLCSNKKQIKYIGLYHNIEEIENVKQQIIEDNNAVVFPSQFMNSKTIKPTKLEYIFLQRNTTDEENITRLSNEYGKYVEHKTSNKQWTIVDKLPYQKEETFWVYGKHPKKDRKTIIWIINELLPNAMENTDIIQILTYNNKVIFKYDHDFDFVICKNQSDAIRMYNILEKEFKKNKQIIFTGMVKQHTDRTNAIVNMIKEKTGWELYKIYRTSTRS